MSSLMSNTRAQVDCDIAFQRETLRRRQVPGGEDSVGDDPLATLCEESAPPPCDDLLLSTGPIRLELGMDAALLDNILAELEVNHLVSFRAEVTEAEARSSRRPTNKCIMLHW